MSDDPKIVKTIIPSECPHCNKSLFLSYQMMVPMLTSILKPEDIKNSKEEVKKKLDEINFNDPEEKKDIVKWLEDEETLIGKSDVEEILQQIILSQKNGKISNQNTK